MVDPQPSPTLKISVRDIITHRLWRMGLPSDSLVIKDMQTGLWYVAVDTAHWRNALDVWRKEWDADPESQAHSYPGPLPVGHVHFASAREASRKGFAGRFRIMHGSTAREA